MASVPAELLSPVSRLSFSENSLASLLSDGLIVVRDKRQLQAPVRVQHPSVTGSKTWGSLQYDHTGKYLAAGGSSSIQVFACADSYKVVRTLVGHKAMVNGLHWRESGAELISSSTDGVVVLWGVRQ